MNWQSSSCPPARLSNATSQTSATLEALLARLKGFLSALDKETVE